MENATRQKLAAVAREKALKPFHGYLEGQGSNLAPVIRHFPKWTLKDADKLWCAAFVYYCCIEAGFVIPYRPDECITCHLAGCLGWEEYAVRDARIAYHRREAAFWPGAGNIVLYDRFFIGQEHDHIGIVLEAENGVLAAAEGNVGNKSGIIYRPIDGHIRAYIRIPDGYQYESAV